MKRKLTSMLLAVALTAGAASGQSISLEELAAKVDERSQILGGYEDFLMDPDPKRAMAALQIMLESGDDGLVQMALNHGLASPDSALRQTALKAYFDGKPSLAVSVTTEGLTDEKNTLELMDQVFRNLNGSWGVNNRGSVSIKVGDYNEELGCNIRAASDDICATRVNATSVSVYLASHNENRTPSQWVEMILNENGSLEGGLIGTLCRGACSNTPPLKATIRLIE